MVLDVEGRSTDDSVMEYAVEGLILHLVPGSPAELNMLVLGPRLKTTQAALTDIFGRDEPARAPIHVYLTDGESEETESAGRLHMTYTADTPVEAVERLVVAPLLGASNSHPQGAALPIDGLLGYLDARRSNHDISTIDAAVAAAQRSGGSLLSDERARSNGLYSRAATSFIAYLLAEYGADRLRQWLIRGQEGPPDHGAKAVYGKSLDMLEAEWLLHIGSAERKLTGTADLLRQLLGFVRPYWIRGVLLLSGLIVGLAWYIVAPQIYRVLINDALLHRDERLVVVLALLLAVTAVVSFGGNLAAGYLSARLGTAVSQDLRLAVFTHLQRLSLDYYNRTQTSDITSRFSPGLDTIESSLTQTFPRAISLALQITIAVALLFVVEWHLALVCLALCPIIYAVPRALGPASRRAGNERQQDAARLASMVQDQAVAQPMIKAFGLHETLLQRFRQEALRLAGSSFTLASLSSVLEGITGLSARFFQALLVGIGSVLIVRGYFTMGALYTFYLYLQYTIEGLLALAALAQPIQHATSAMQQVRELLDEPPHVNDAEAAHPLPRLAREIRFDEVTFSYTGEQANLNGVSMAFPAERYTVIVGPSGCGKSTVLNLLMRFYDPISGAVTFDGHDLRGATQESLRRQISVVFQEPFLLNSTVRENIRSGRMAATDQEVEDAARAAQIHDFITGLPQGYDTPIGERGGHLSGGQRQRLALARAIVRKPAVLLLDEATSALDSQTEAAINETLAHLAKECTIISITHRLSAATQADLIWVLDRGKVAEHGTHAELMEQQGLYSQLFHRQAEIAAEFDEEALVHRLRGIGILKGMDAGRLSALAGRFVTETWDADQLVCAQGEPADRFYLIQQGQVEVLITGPSGGELLVAVLRDGDHFGEMAFRTGGTRQATVRTVGPTVLLALDQEHALQESDSSLTLPRSERELLLWMRQQGEASLQEAAMHLGKDEMALQPALDRLVDSRLIEALESNGHVRYRVPRQPEKGVST